MNIHHRPVADAARDDSEIPFARKSTAAQFFTSTMCTRFPDRIVIVKLLLLPSVLYGVAAGCKANMLHGRTGVSTIEGYF